MKYIKVTCQEETGKKVRAYQIWKIQKRKVAYAEKPIGLSRLLVKNDERDG